MKKLVSVVIAVVLICALFAGCSGQPAEETPTEAPEINEQETQEPAPEPVEEPAEEAEAVEEPAPEEPAAAGTKAVLVVSFGTSYNESRDITIGAIETAIADAYPDYDVRRAFTAQTIIDILAEREGLEIDNMDQAMEKLVADGVKEVILQPTHLMNGLEYDDMVETAGEYKDSFDAIAVGEPLLTSDEDLNAVTEVITSETQAMSDDETAVVFMGHGTEHAANAVYATLQETITAAGHSNYFIGTVEAAPTLEDVMAKVEEGGYKKVVLQPLMVVSGDHATNDMAGDEEDSWKSVFTAAGYEVEPVLRGLGEFEGIQKIYVQHVQAAIDSLADGDSGDAATEQQGDATEENAGTLQDGTYPIKVDSSSSMFKVVDAQLTVKDGELTAVLTLSGTGYEKLYMGTIEQAQEDSDDNAIYFVEDAEGAYTYEVPVTALDADIDVAAWSIKKEQWYDRVLVFESSSLPAEAFGA